MKKRGKIKKLLCLLTALTMLPVFSAANAQESTVTGILPVQNIVNEDGTVTISGKITGSGTAKVLVAAYDAAGNLTSVSLSDDIDLASGEGLFDVTTGKPGAKVNMLVWNNLTSITPLHDVITLSDTAITATDMANGVRVSWDAVEGATSYDLYREGTLVAADLTTTTYDEKYFDYLESYLGEQKSFFGYSDFTTDTLQESVTADVNHTYTVVANNNIILQSDDGKADVKGKMAYITFQSAGQDWLTSLYSGWSGYGRKSANGIKMYGNNNSMKAAKNETWQGANMYFTRSLAADSDGYIKATYSSATTPVASIGYDSVTYGTSLMPYLVNKYELGRQDLYAGTYVGGTRSVAYKKDAEGYLLDASGNRVTDVANAAIDEEMAATYGGDAYTFASGTSKNVYDTTPTTMPQINVELFNEDVDKTGTQYTILMTAKMKNSWRQWNGIYAQKSDGTFAAVGFSNPWLVNQSKAFGVSGTNLAANAGGTNAYQVNTYRWDTMASNITLHPDANSQGYNLMVTAREEDRWLLLHSLAIARTSEFIK